MVAGMKITRIHHLTVAVRDTDRAAQTFAALLGLRPDGGDTASAFGVRTRDLALGDSTLQLAAPLQDDGPVMRFIERKGEGFYNLALEVDDLDEAIESLAGRGIKVSEPVDSSPGVRSSFITMSATHGLSIQLVQVTGTPAAPAAMPGDELASAAPFEQQDEAPLLDLTPDEWSDTD